MMIKLKVVKLKDNNHTLTIRDTGYVWLRTKDIKSVFHNPYSDAHNTISTITLYDGGSHLTTTPTEHIIDTIYKQEDL